MKKRTIWIILIIGVLLFTLSFIFKDKTEEINKPPAEIPKGILVSEIPTHIN